MLNRKVAYENKNNDLMPSPGKQCQYRGSTIIGTLITVPGLLGFQFSDFDFLAYIMPHCTTLWAVTQSIINEPKCSNGIW